MLEKVKEAELHDDGTGLAPAGDGWFIVNVSKARGAHSDDFGGYTRFESSAAAFGEFGINVNVLQPGQPLCRYHREDAQEDFLVLAGECIAIVEDEERPMRRGDFLHTPNGTAHVLVGAGNAPSIVLAVGTRKDPEEVLYPASEVAGRHGAAVETDTPDPEVAYAGCEEPQPRRVDLSW